MNKYFGISILAAVLMAFLFAASCASSTAQTTTQTITQPAVTTTATVAQTLPPMTTTITLTQTIPPVTVTVTTTTTATPTSTATAPTGISALVSKVAPSVVRVITDTGMGSGIIVDKQGYVLANNHVIEGSKSIKVILADRREYNATTVGKDEIKDLAVLRISATNLLAATLGDSEELKAGDEVIAIGFPLDLTGSATASMGNVATFRADTESGLTYIQMDASINPGSSGGAIINSAGEVVGILVSTIRIAGGLSIEGIDVAIAIDGAKPSIPRLVAGESILKPPTWLTYTNAAYGYTIQYPSTWIVTPNNTPGLTGQIIIQGPSYSKVLIGPLYQTNALDTASAHVDRMVTWRKLYISYQVFSRIDVMWQGVYKACVWINREQYSANYLPLSEKHLTLIREGYVFEVSGQAATSEWGSYSSTFDTIIDSFRFTN